MPGPYSAGSVFLQVVPSFQGVQDAIGEQAREIGRSLGKEMADNVDKEAGKGIPKALDKALNDPGTKRAAREAGKTAAENFTSPFVAGLRKNVQAAMNTLGKDTDRGLGQISERLGRLNDVAIRPDFDASRALAELVQLETALRAASGDRELELEVRVDADEAAEKIAAIRRDIEARKMTLEVDADTAAALTKLAVLDRDRKVTIETDVDTSKLGVFERLMKRAGFATNDASSEANLAANSFRGFNGMLLGVVTIGPLLIPILAAIAGGVGALAISLGVAATAAIPFALAIAGIGAAVGAMADVERESAQDTAAYARTMRTASNGVRDAQISLQRARESAAEGTEASGRRIRDALEAEQDAQDGIADAQRAAQRAQEDLTRSQQAAVRAQEQLQRARERAADQLEDMALRLRGGALAERQAVIDLFEAQVAFRNAMNDPGATGLEREQAAIAYERQSLALEEIRQQNARNAEESARATAAGIEGSEEVVGAQDAIAAANQGVVDSQQSVADANDAIIEAQERAADAAEATRDAQVAAARDQRDSARSIEDAQRRLEDAQLSYQDALFRTGELGSASMQKLNEAMAKLSPAGQGFALFLFGLREEFQELRNVAQEGFLPGLQEGLATLIATYGPGFTTFVGEISTLLGGLARAAGNALTGPVWQEFFGMVGEYAPIFLRQWASISGSLLTAFAAIATAAAPFVKTIGDIWVVLFEQFAAWATSPEGAKMITDFLTYVAEVTPDVMRFIGALAGALLTLAVAVAPYAGVLLEFFIGILDFIGGMDPQLLGNIVLTVFILIGAFQAMLSIFAGAGLVVQVMAAVMLGAVGSTMALIVGGVILVIGAFVLLYANFEWFRDAVAVVWDAIKIAWNALVDGILWYGENILLPWWRFLANTFMWVWDNLLRPVFDAWWAVVSWLWEHVLGPIFRFIWEAFKVVAETIWWFWTKVLGPVFELFGAVVKALWDNAIGPFYKNLREGWEIWATAFADVWNARVKPILDIFGEYIATYIAPAFQRGIDAIAAIWNSLGDLAKAPVRFVIEEIINKGIVENFNKLAKAFGTSEIEPLALPAFFAAPSTLGSGGGALGGMQRFATGGYVGGASPSDTADNIPAWLTAGEYVQPVKVVRTYGADLFEAFRQGQIDPRIARQLLGYAKGGQVRGYAAGGLVGFGRLLQSMGFSVGEHPAFGGVHPVHMKNSLHYSGRAIDVNWAPGTSAAEMAAIDRIIPLARQAGLGTIWRVKNHFNHAHFEDSNYSAIGSGISSVADAIGGAISKFIDDPLGMLRAGVQKITGPVMDNPFGQMLLGGVGKLVDAAGDFLLGNAPGEVAVPEGKTRLYDKGGIVPPGLSGVLNLTRGNEHMGILTDDQWAALHRVAEDGASRGDFIVQQYLREDSPAQEMAEAVLFVQRHAQRGGVYNRKGATV